MNKEDFAQLRAKLNLGLGRRVPQILQTEAAECGLACLAMICGYYGKQTDLINLRRRFDVSTRGMTLRHLMALAAEMQLRSRALELDLDELGALKTPCVLHWNMNHFVVLISVRGNRVTIQDPAYGRRILSMAEVSASFTGIALELWPENSFTREKSEERFRIRTLMANASGLFSAMSKLFCFALLIEAVNLMLPVGMQLVLDHVIPAKDTDLLTLICLGLLLFVLFRTAMGTLRAWTSLVMTTLLDVQWKSQLFEHLVTLPLAYFEKRKLGDIQSRFNSLDTLKTTLTSNIISGLMDGIMSVGLLVMLVLYGGGLVWVVLGFTLLYLTFRLATYPRYRRINEEMLLKSARSGSHFMETLYGIGTLKALGLSAARTQYWLNLNIEVANVNISKTRFDLLFTGASTLIGTLSQISLLWLGAKQVIDGQMTVGMFIAFNTYRGQFADRTSSLLDQLLQLRMLTLHAQRIADIALMEQEPAAPPREVVPAGEPAAIHLHELSFQYDALSPPLFSDFSLSVAAGECIAITGPSGKGKTTLMKVMAGLLQPSAGEVRVNGLDVSKIGLNNYRSCIACVLQDDTLFAGSIADNIAGFGEQRDQARIEECARLASIDQEINRMPMSYETLVSELGGSLSGGQKQRVLIARALYRRPSILFLDEATSHLDTDNESRINAAVHQLNITRIIIAHRPSTIASADRVIAL